MRLGILASGRGSNFASIADSCQEQTLSAKTAVVISNKSDAGVFDRAKTRNIPAHFIPYDQFGQQKFERQAVSLLKEYECDLIVLAGFMKVLSPYFLEQFPERVLNIHPSLLPAFKGLQAQKQALEYGVTVTGCTVHVVTEKVDSGPIVDQAAVPVRDDDTVSSLSKRILREEHKLFPSSIQKYINDYFKEGKTA